MVLERRGRGRDVEICSRRRPRDRCLVGTETKNHRAGQQHVASNRRPQSDAFLFKRLIMIGRSAA
jgi:hypothetical protein